MVNLNLSEIQITTVRMQNYLDGLVEKEEVTSKNSVMLTPKNDEPKWGKALLGEEAEK